MTYQVGLVALSTTYSSMKTYVQYIFIRQKYIADFLVNV
jgi:hypothetical protein